MITTRNFYVIPKKFKFLVIYTTKNNASTYVTDFYNNHIMVAILYVCMYVCIFNKGGL